MDIYDYLFIFLYVIPCLLSAWGISEMFKHKEYMEYLVRRGIFRLSNPEEETSKTEEELMNEFYSQLSRFKTFLCVTPVVNWVLPVILISAWIK